jgi:transcriptional regulator with XRE-family HTH domain
VPLGKRKSAGHRKVPDQNAAAIGQRIRRLRMERELTFDAFVEETGLGRGYVSELERGLVLPNVNVIRRVADVLDLTMADLVLGSSLREKLFEATLGLDTAALERVFAAVTAHHPGGGGKAGAKGRGGK